MSIIINYEDFQNICRTCLFIGKLRPIIDSVIIEIIRGITGIEVKSDTDFPQKICESCFKKIYKINEFAVQCKRNELILNKYKIEYFEHKSESESINIKEEIITEDEMVQIKEEIKTEHISEPIEHIVSRQNPTNCNSTETSQESSTTNETNYHKCPECNQTFIRIRELKKHQRLHRKVVFECEVCSSKFSESCALIEHHRTHKDQFPYTCDVCNKPIRHIATLNRHKLIHKNQKPQCSVCFKIFYDFNALKIHRCTHSFVCKICCKKFNSLHFLRCHYRAEHPVEYVDDLVENPDQNDAKKAENEAAFEEVVVKSEITSDKSQFMAEESDENEANLFVATTKHKKKNEEPEHETQKCETESNEMDLLSQVDPQNLLVINEERDGDKMNLTCNSNNCFDGKRIRDRNFCMFCKTTVLNFVRHITRNHLKEPEVRKVMSAPVGSKERKNLLSLLRKRGNYMINLKNCRKPVKKSNVAGKFLPCVYCLGFYSSNQLWKHRKQCIANLSKGAKMKMNRPCADAQNLLVQHLKVDKALREAVFPRMRADDVSMVAKNDALIRAFGARYIKRHDSEKHIVNVTSRKMRELAKLLMALRRRDPAIRNLLQCLSPGCFDAVVAAVRTVAKYDEAKNAFASPTYALQMGTTLRHCCEIALTEDDVFDSILADVAKQEIRHFVTLLESNWKLIVPNQLVEKTDDFVLNLDLDLNLNLSEMCTEKVAKSKRVLVPWTSEQKRVVDAFFKNHIADKRAPKKPECEALRRAHPVLLQNKNWLKIKVYVQNKYTK